MSKQEQPDRDALAAAAKQKANKAMHAQKDSAEEKAARHKAAEEERQKQAEEDIKTGIAAVGKMSGNAQEVMELLKLNLRKDVRDPTMDLIAHISKCIAVLKELVDVLISTGRSKNSSIPEAFYECMLAGAREYCIHALSFNVNYEQDRLTGSGFFDTTHMILGFLPHLPMVPNKLGQGKCILHEAGKMQMNEFPVLDFIILYVLTFSRNIRESNTNTRRREYKTYHSILS